MADKIAVAVDFFASIAETCVLSQPVLAGRIIRRITLANSPQARKRARQNTARRSRNMSARSSLRTAIKQFLKLVGGGAPDVDAATAAYRAAVSSIDRAVSKGLHHKNRAARLKSRLNNRLRAASAAGAA